MVVGRIMRVALYLSILLLVVVPLAAWRGGGPERWATAIWVTGTAATYGAVRWWATSYRTIEPAIFIIDCIGAVALVALAYFANRQWTSWLAAIHFSAVLVHVLKWHDPGIEGWLYQIFMKVQGWAVLALIVAGIVRHRRRVARLGADASWRNF